MHRTSRRIPFAAAVLLPLAVLAACSPAPVMAPPDAVARLPERFETAPADTGYVPGRWWRGYNDPVLDGLVDSALARNLDLEAAVARVRELQNLYRISGADLFPAVRAGVEGSTSSTPSNVGATGSISERIPDFPDRFDITQYSATLGLSYELDFWGRVRSARSAALREYFATRSDLQTVRIGVAAETIATYLEIRELERQIELTTETTGLLEERAALSEDRYARGLITSFELYAVRQEFEQARTALPQLESRLAEAVGRLALVLGGYPGEVRALLSEAGEPSTAPSPVPAGLPSELLLRRPDVQAASQRLEAARQRIGVARAEQFPRFSLTGTGGTQSGELADLVDTGQNFFSLAGSATAALFNAGALRANKRAAHERYAQAAARYEKTVLTAFKEVESALVALEKEGEVRQALAEELAYASASAAVQEDRYLRGVGDYLAYLDARRNLLRVRSSVTAADRRSAVARLNLHRALGGAWVPEPEL